METQISGGDSKVIIRLIGRFDFSSHREFRDTMSDALKAVGDGDELWVDLSGVEYLDSSALGMLLILRDKASNIRCEVILSNCKGAVKQVIEIANFNKLFRLQNDPEA